MEYPNNRILYISENEPAISAPTQIEHGAKEGRKNKNLLYSTIFMKFYDRENHS